MNYLIRYTILLSSISLAGCVASLYISPELADIPNSSLSKIVDRYPRFIEPFSHYYSRDPIVSVDGVVLPTHWWALPNVYISPGRHEVTYRYKHYILEYDTWYRHVGNTTTQYKGYRPVSHQKQDKCNLTFEAGQKYTGKKLLSMLNDAGCKILINAK